MKKIKFFFKLSFCLVLTSCDSQNEKSPSKLVNDTASSFEQIIPKVVVFHNNSELNKPGFVRMPLYEQIEFNIFISKEKKNVDVFLNQDVEFFYSGDTHIPFILAAGDSVIIENNTESIPYILTSINIRQNNKIGIFQEAIKNGIPLYFTELDNQRNGLIRKKELLNKIDEIQLIYGKSLKFVEKYLAEKKLDDDFTEFVRQYIKYDNYIKIFTYCNNREIIDSLYKTEFFNFEIDENNKYFKSNYAYFGALYQSLVYRYRNKLSALSGLKILQFIDSNYSKSQGDILKLFYLRNYAIEILQSNPDGFITMVESVKNNDYNKYLRNIFTDFSYQKDLKDSISDLEGKEYSLKSILSNVNGNVKYIDFWASWCAPCREEFKYYPEILKNFQLKNIDFITISIDKSSEGWKKALFKEQLDKKFKNYFYPNPSKENVTAFRLETIPRYIIVNNKGRVINFDAPRPSDPKLIPLLDKILTENPTNELPLPQTTKYNGLRSNLLTNDKQVSRQKHEY
jgi:thiol-disulfide isomerase/thioredoxin